ncbi:hypothetical protein Tco_0999883 [Tanacetum coccineum]
MQDESESYGMTSSHTTESQQSHGQNIQRRGQRSYPGGAQTRTARRERDIGAGHGDRKLQAWLAAQKADAAQRRANQTHDILEAERTRYTLQTNPHMNDLRTVEELARDLARDNNNESSSGEEEVEESGGDYSD